MTTRYGIFDAYGVPNKLSHSSVNKKTANTPKKGHPPLSDYNLYYLTLKSVIFFTGHFSAQRPQFTHFEESIAASAPFIAIA